jgi:predicted TIM-barrel fold metal-dependent hydrolase
VTELEYPAFDCDNHYYEALDAFTRHLDPKMGPRTVQWCEIDGRKYHVVGGKVSRAVTNATFNPIAKAGAMHDYFRGNPDGKSPLEFLREREPIGPEYLHPEARLARMDEFGLEAIWLFPTLGVLYEELLKDDIPAVTATFTAFNRWIAEDWGFAYEGRIFGAPYLTLADPDWAVTELEWALDEGARVIVMRPAAVFTEHGPRSPADPMFDPFWARVAEAGITTVIHAGDSGYSSQGYADDKFTAQFSGGGWQPSVRMFAIERAALDFLLTLSLEKLYDRHPGLRIASVENGSEFLPDLFRKLASTAKKYPGWFPEDPADTFRRHVWINPFWEDDVHEVVDCMGADRVVFGSDWPHIEALPEPRQYQLELKDLDAADQKLILNDNARSLLTPRPT